MKLLFGKKKQTAEKISFDPRTQRAVLRCGICTGEQVAGFRNIQTGKFEEVMLIRNDEDLAQFKTQYGIQEISKEY